MMIQSSENSYYFSVFILRRNVTLDIEMKLETKAVYNVIGTVVGGEEPGKTCGMHTSSPIMLDYFINAGLFY